MPVGRAFSHSQAKVLIRQWSYLYALNNTSPLSWILGIFKSSTAEKDECEITKKKGAPA